MGKALRPLHPVRGLTRQPVNVNRIRGEGASPPESLPGFRQPLASLKAPQSSLIAAAEGVDWN